MDRKEAFARIEEERRQKQQKESQERREYREKERWNKIHWKEIGWGASYEKQDVEFWKSPRYEYALWYYHKRGNIFSLAIPTILLSVFFLVRFISNHRFSDYFYSAFLMGLSMAITTMGDDYETYAPKTRSQYEFFNKTSSSQMLIRLGHFAFGLVLLPIALWAMICQIAEFLANRKFPVPYYEKDGSGGGSYEKKVGRIDDHGNIYRND